MFTKSSSGCIIEQNGFCQKRVYQVDKKNKGYIKLYRGTTDNHFLMRNNNAYLIFTKLLMLVNRTNGKYKTSKRRLAKLTNVHESSVLRTLNRLKKEGMIELSNQQEYTEITVCNWFEYQLKSDSKGEPLLDHQVNHQVNHSEKEENHKSEPQVEPHSEPKVNRKQEKELNNNKYISEVDEQLNNFLVQLIGVINRREKPTNTRIGLLRARKKDGYSDEEILLAARTFSTSKWHKDNKQMTIDNFLRPSKFGIWYMKSQDSGGFKQYDYNQKKDSYKPLEREKELTPEQEERGKLIKEMIASKNFGFRDIQGKTNEELKLMIEAKK